jgi:hypothetical protein
MIESLDKASQFDLRRALSSVRHATSETLREAGAQGESRHAADLADSASRRGSDDRFLLRSALIACAHLAEERCVLLLHTLSSV